MLALALLINMERSIELEFYKKLGGYPRGSWRMTYFVEPDGLHMALIKQRF